ncbi:MAG: DoxX family protein [Flavobacteriaceae bacterium]|jgi:putative oxidoreductase
MKNLLLSKKSYLSETSYLIMRFFTGLMMCYYHGWSKLMADASRWEKLGSTITQWMGLDALSIPFGFIASFSESIGALLIAFGLLTRPAAFLMGFTMLVASTKKISEGGFDGSELAILYLILSLVIFSKGSGRFSLDRVFFK